MKVGQIISPVKFLGMSDLNKVEKDLENILAVNMLDTLFEDNPYLVIFQERQRQAEPDIIALDATGDIVIFELKRGIADECALPQIFRYVQNVQGWDYYALQDKVRTYIGDSQVDLRKLHQDAFNLSQGLSNLDFNRKQKLIIVGNSIDNRLISSIDYWKKQGVDIDYIPYRIYQIADNFYFEFFAKPYDVRSNPKAPKGVMFDTNFSFDPDALNYMLQKKRISAFGDRIDAVHVFNKGDTVFFSHKGYGLVAVGEIVSDVKRDIYKGQAEKYCDVKFKFPPNLTAFSLANSRIIEFWRVSSILGKKFYWARTDKRPYLNSDECNQLVQLFS